MILSLLVRLKQGRCLAFDAALRRCLDRDFGVGKTSVCREASNKWTVLVDADAQLLELEFTSAKNTFIMRSIIPERCSGECQLHEHAMITSIHNALVLVGARVSIPALRPV